MTKEDLISIIQLGKQIVRLDAGDIEVMYSGNIEPCVSIIEIPCSDKNWCLNLLNQLIEMLKSSKTLPCTFNKILLDISYPENRPLLMKEFDCIQAWQNLYNVKAPIIWGLREHKKNTVIIVFVGQK